MGVNRRTGVRRAYQPSGPWIDEAGNPARAPSSATWTEEKTITTKPAEPPNPKPDNYKILRAKEIGGHLLIELQYPDCTNYEGRKILLFRSCSLIDLVNQRLIDPHFFQDPNLKSPCARFEPTEEGWKMGLTLITSFGSKLTRSPGSS